MDKILVEVYCGATDKTYDFLLPGLMKVKVARNKIMEQICAFEQNDNLFEKSSMILLADKDGREILNEDFTLEQAGISGGNRLIII